MSSAPFRFVVASLLLAAVAIAPRLSAAQQAPAAPVMSPTTSLPASPAPTVQAPATPSPAPSAKPGETGINPAPGAAQSPVPVPSGEGATGEVVDLPARPFVYVEGKADKDEIYSAILASLVVVRSEMDKAKLTPAGRPLAVFVESDDTGFKYHAGYPVSTGAEGKSSLSDAVKIGQTPSGKAMRFEHEGAYGDIDATYDAITAYLDDKGIDAQDTFVEEYVNDVKDSDDPTLHVNIYVLLK
jgi:effector-binding domain-containing protein